MADLVSQLGFPVAVCLILLWWINKQLSRQSAQNQQTVDRLQMSEDWIRTTLSDMNNKLTAVVLDNSHAMRDLLHSNKEICRALRDRPCLRESDIETTTIRKEKP
jgi:hypothetical protein